ncbi:MAG: single-stranded DNA-binding protein [Flavobacteriales bacterium]|nr:single-stranded DNA-binding protein [Flavobacteriales bacterium]|tara:strand:+ start:245 stop:697 length:453 start_codon:yes stop_codon:yes gene_type:complete
MSGVNKVILIGNLGKDPEVKHLDTGVSVANFSLATTETYNNKQGERVSQTEWHNIVLWRGLADIAEKYLKKGNSVYVEGKINTRKWEDKEGNTRYSTDIIAEKMTMLGSRNDSNSSASTITAPNNTNNNEDQSNNSQNINESSNSDDLPF